jgi:uncharacterized phage protein (TIGR02218 family)
VGRKENRISIGEAMKSASPELINHLNTTRQFKMADLFTVTLASGAVYRYTTADISVTSGGQLFQSTALIQRSGTKTSAGIEVDSLTLTVSAEIDVQVNGVPFMAAAFRGDFDGASVQLERAFFTEWALSPVGTLILFKGRVADVDGDRLGITIEVKSDLERFNIMMPRRVYQPGCSNALFDYSCGIARSSYVLAGVVQAGSTALRVITNLSLATGWSSLGTLEFQTGVNAGQKRTVKYSQGGTFDLVNRLLAVPAAGDTVHVYPGCDKTLNTCASKFANTIRFRGQPYIPRPENAL